jgi:hypothetical protein
MLAKLAKIWEHESSLLFLKKISFVLKILKYNEKAIRYNAYISHKSSLTIT